MFIGHEWTKPEPKAPQRPVRVGKYVEYPQGRRFGLRRALHRIFGWHNWHWIMPHHTYDTCTICGATERRHGKKRSE